MFTIPRCTGHDRHEGATRERLFEAGAIIESVRLAIASNLETDDIETTAGNALQVTARIIDDVASQLEGVNE